MFKHIEWIFFDVGSTLVDESKAFDHLIIDAITGTEITYDQFYDNMIKYYKQNRKGDLETLKQYGLAMPEWHFEDELLYCSTVSCLKSLSQRYKLGVIANQPLGIADRMRALGILDYFDLVISSAEDGVSKPDIRIYKLALERSGCKAENALMIGDRIDNDIAPAKSIGMKTIWIKQGFGKYSTPRSVLEVPHYTVEDLMEINKLVD